VTSYDFKVKRASDTADWLQSQDWKHFITMTTPYELTLGGARRLSERFYERAVNNVFDGTSSRMFWVAEKFEAKDGFHLHGLIDYNDGIFPAGNGWEVLSETYQITSGARKKGENFRVQFAKYDSRRAAGKYCAKYLLKECADYDVL